MAAGFPGVFPGGLTIGYKIIGAVQKQVSGAAGYPGVFTGGLTTGYTTIGAVQKAVAAGGPITLTVTDGMMLSDVPAKQENHLLQDKMLLLDRQYLTIDKLLLDRIYLADSIVSSFFKILFDSLFIGDSGLAQIIAGLVERLATDKILLLDYVTKIQEGELIDGLLIGDQKGPVFLSSVLQDRFFVTDTIVLQALKVFRDLSLLGDSGLSQKVLQLLQQDLMLIADLRLSQTEKTVQDIIETSEYVVKLAQALMGDNLLVSDVATVSLLSAVIEYLIWAKLRVIDILSVQAKYEVDYLGTRVKYNEDYLEAGIGWNNTEVSLQ